MTWLAGFLALYRALVLRPWPEFVKAVEAKGNYGKPPYGVRQRRLALRGLALAIVLDVVAFLPFASDLPIEYTSSHPAFSEMLIRGGGFIYLGIVPTVTYVALWLFHGTRQFLATLFPNGFLAVESGGHGQSNGNDSPTSMTS